VLNQVKPSAGLHSETVLTAGQVSEMTRLVQARQAVAAERMVRSHGRRLQKKSKPLFAPGDRVFVHAPTAHKVRRNVKFPWSFAAWVYKCENHDGVFSYRLRWITFGLAGEAANEISKNLFPASDLRPIDETILTSDLEKLPFGASSAVQASTQSVTKRTPKKAEKLEEGVFYVDHVIAWRKTATRREYLVKWTDYGWDQCTWEPEYVVFSNCFW